MRLLRILFLCALVTIASAQFNQNPEPESTSNELNEVGSILWQIFEGFLRKAQQSLEVGCNCNNGCNSSQVLSSNSSEDFDIVSTESSRGSDNVNSRDVDSSLSSDLESGSFGFCDNVNSQSTKDSINVNFSSASSSSSDDSSNINLQSSEGSQSIEGSINENSSDASSSSSDDSGFNLQPSEGCINGISSGVSSSSSDLSEDSSSEVSTNIYSTSREGSSNVNSNDVDSCSSIDQESTSSGVSAKDNSQPSEGSDSMNTSGGNSSENSRLNSDSRFPSNSERGDNGDSVEVGGTFNGTDDSGSTSLSKRFDSADLDDESLSDIYNNEYGSIYAPRPGSSQRRYGPRWHNGLDRYGRWGGRSRQFYGRHLRTGYRSIPQWVRFR